jgi:arginine/ornithine N-succinyltransferase beta subunit
VEEGVSVLEDSVGALELEELDSTEVVSAGALSVAVGTSAPWVIVMYSVTVVVASDPSSVHEPVSDAAGMSDEMVVYVVTVVVPP